MKIVLLFAFVFSSVSGYCGGAGVEKQMQDRSFIAATAGVARKADALSEELYSAVLANDQQSILRISRNSYFGVCLGMPHGIAAFAVAASRGNEQLVKMLNRSSDTPIVNAMDQHGRSALVEAAEHGQTKIVTYLIEEGADVFHVDARYLSAVDAALYKKQGDSARAILEEINAHGKVRVYLQWEKVLADVRKALGRETTEEKNGSDFFRAIQSTMSSLNGAASPPEESK